MIPFPSIPDIPGWIQDQLGDLGDFINPFEWFAKAIRGVYSLLAWYFEFVIAHPPRFEDREVEDYLYGNAIGLAGFVISMVTFFLLCFAVLQVKRVITLAEAVVIGTVITAGAPVVYAVIDSMIQMGDVLSVSMMFGKNARGDKDSLLGLTLDATINPLLLIAGLGPTSLVGGFCMLVVFMYELLVVLLKIIFLPALALRILGPRFRAFSDWTISAGVIAMVLGRPVMVLCIELGKWAGDNLLDSLAASKVFFLIAGMTVGIALQYVMFKQVQKVVAKVSGNTTSRVFGKVETEQKPNKVNSTDALDRYKRTFSHHDSHSSSRFKQSVKAGKTYVKHETKHAVAAGIAVKAGQAATAAGTGGSSAVALAAISKAAQSSAKRSAARRDRP